MGCVSNPQTVPDSDDQKYDNTSRKILLLGPNGSGKSTFFKQLYYISKYNQEYTVCDKENDKILKIQIYEQIIDQVKRIIDYRRATCVDMQYKFGFMVDYVNDGNLPQNFVDDIKTVWQNDHVIQSFFSPQSDQYYKVPELKLTTQYFINNIDRINRSDYVPSKDDMLRLSYSTTGVIEKKLTLRDTECHVCDLGGSRRRRKKWIHCFDRVHTLIFMVDLSCYDSQHRDWDTNAMEDSLELFGYIINNQWFTHTHMVLLLNMTDLFQQKIKYIPIDVCSKFNDFDQFIRRYKGVTVIICNYFCSTGHISSIPSDIKYLVAKFCGFALNVYEIENAKLDEMNAYVNHDMEFKNSKYEYEACRYYIRYKFESLNERNNKQNLKVYFTSSLDRTNVEYVMDEILKPNL